MTVLLGNIKITHMSANNFPDDYPSRASTILYIDNVKLIIYLEGEEKRNHGNVCQFYLKRKRSYITHALKSKFMLYVEQNVLIQ